MAELPVLYSFRRCPYAMRARHALLVSEQAVEIREVVLRDKPEALLSASAKGTVPVLVLPDGRVLDESLDIIDWALERGDPEGWRPVTPEDRAITETLILQNDGPFKLHLDGFKYGERGSVEALGHREATARVLASLDARLRAGPHLLGPRRTRVDVALLPFVRQLANADRRWFDAADWPGLQRWLAEWTTSATFAAVMEKLPQWSSGDPPRRFPPVSPH